MGENISTREAYGRALKEFGSDEKIYVFDADLKKCTMTTYFESEYPERFFNIGIAEANMVDIAAGFAACGATALVHTFAILHRVAYMIRFAMMWPTGTECKGNRKSCGTDCRGRRRNSSVH